MPAYAYSAALLARAGSFWRTSLADSERVKVQSLLSAGGVGPHMEAPFRVEALASMRGEERTGSFGLSFSRTDVVDLTGHMSEALALGFLDADGVMVESVTRPTTPVDGVVPYIINTGSGYLLLFNGASGISPTEPAWSVQVPLDLRIDAVRTSAGVLLHAGRDFYAQGRGVLVFREPVHDLFPAGTIPVESGFRIIYGTRHALSRSPNLIPGTGKFLMECIRGRRSHVTLLRAAAEYAGYFVVQRDGYIQDVEVGEESVRYITDHGTFTTMYAHTPLPRGAVSAGTMVGCPAGVVSDKDNGWWTHVLAAGFSLDGVCPVQGLRVPGGLVRVELYTHASGHTCTRFHLEGDNLEEYWELVAAAEQRTNTTLGNTAGLTSAGDNASVNGVDFIMETALDGRLIVFSTGGVPTARKELMEAFLKECSPASKGLVFV